jgi:hypothetical protein
MISKATESYPPIQFRVAIPRWELRDEIAFMIGSELKLLGHKPIYFFFYEDVPEDIDILLTFGPYGKILPIWQQAASRDQEVRPITMHWNTEGIPDLRMPPWLVEQVGSLRSSIGRLSYSRSSIARVFSRIPPLSWCDRIYFRYRYYGDYKYAYEKGWLHILFDTSAIYAKIRAQSGLPTFYAPWGASPYWYKDLNLERDIDVLWMGVRGTARRSHIIDKVTKVLRSQGAVIHIADNKENPFIFGDLRTRYLNRAKITLNVTRTWYDDNFSRFLLAAPNRSLIVSEPVLQHCREFQEGVHYVSAEIEDLSKTILYYLENEAERQQIVENAYQFVTQELLFSGILENMLQTAVRYGVQETVQKERKPPLPNGLGREAH